MSSSSQDHHDDQSQGAVAITPITKPCQLPSHPIVNAFRTNLLHDLSSQPTSSSSKTTKNQRRPIDEKNIHDDNDGATHFKKVSQALGWRNQYSQSTYYPITISVPSRQIENYKYGNTTTSENTTPNHSTYTFQVQQVQRGEVENSYGTGATVWPASLVLMKYLEHSSLNGKIKTTNEDIVVADLGAGTGATSIVAALVLNASMVVCTDGSELVVDLARDNIQQVVSEFRQEYEEGCNDDGDTVSIRTFTQNGIDMSSFMLGGCDIQVRKYLWGDGTMNTSDIQYNFIVASDCILPKLYPIAPFVDALDELSSQHTVTYIAYEHRFYPEYDPKERFISLANQKGFTVRVVPLEEQHPIYSVEDIEVWEICRER